MQDKIQIDGVSLTLSNPITNELQWIGQGEVLRQLMACWLVVDEKDLPLAPRLVGPPGIGKTALAMAAAKARNQSLYIYQCTADTRPEDLLITPILGSDGKIAYHASPLVTAMIKGAVCILDEGNRMNEKSWASLAPLLDHRRYVESIVAGVSIQAHRDFRCAVTMNQDDSTYEIPDYIMSRLQPSLAVGFPNREDELAILKYHLPFAAEELLTLTIDFLQQSHSLQLDYSARDGIQLLRYAMKLLAQDPTHPVAKDQVWRQALVSCLGEDALDLQAARARKSRSLGANTLPHGLGDFFLDPDDPMHPDFDDDSLDDDSLDDDSLDDDR